MSSDTPDQPQPTSPEPAGDAAPTAAESLRSQHLDLDTLSAYLDQQLPPADLAAIHAHLATCPECGRDLAELRATVGLLRGLPTYAPRRTFQLGPEHARGGVRGTWLAGWLERLVPALPALRVATAAVAVLLAVVIAGDLVTNRGPAPSPLVQTGGDAVERANAPESRPAPAVQAPAVHAPASEAEMPRAAGFQPTAAPAAEVGTEMEAPASLDDEDRPEGVPGVVAPEPAAEPAPPSSPPGWRLAEVGLGLILVWLVVVLAGASWLRRDRA